MRLAFTIHGLAGGGAERQMSYLINHFARQDEFEIQLLTFDQGTESDYPVHPSVKRIGLAQQSQSRNLIESIVANRRRIRTLREKILSYSPDVVISFCDTTNITTLAACHRTQIPVLICERSDPRKQKLAWTWELSRRWYYPTCSAFVAQTQSIAAYLQKIIGANQRSFVIPSAIAPPVSSPELLPSQADSRRALLGSIEELDRDRTEFQMQQKWLVYVGRLSAEKGCQRLISAWLRLAKQHPDWSLVLVGDGPMRAELVESVRLARLESNVLFAGWQPESWRGLKAADALVLPSFYEGFPNVLLEGLWCRLPIVATKASEAITNVITSGLNGMVTENDEQALETGIDQLLSQPDLQTKISRNAHDSVTPFLWDQVAHQWEEAIRSIGTD